MVLVLGIVWVVLNNNWNPEHKVLDLGGSSSLFSYYLASKGLDVTTVDIQKDSVDNANFVAQKMGWRLTNHVMDMRRLDFDSNLDHITSICVYEHIPLYDRMTLNKNIKPLLVEGGKFSITFDYRNPSKLACINSSKDVYEQFVRPSGLRVRGNEEFFDNGQNWLLHPFYYKRRAWSAKIRAIKSRQFSPCEIFKVKDSNDYTFGALFLKK